MKQDNGYSILIRVYNERYIKGLAMEINKLLGKNFIDADFEVSLKNGRIRLNRQDFNLRYVGMTNGAYIYEGGYDKLRVTCSLLPEGGGISWTTELESSVPLECESIALHLTYREKGVDLSDRRVPCAGKNVADSGLHKIGKWGRTKEDTRFCGLFESSTNPCVFLGTKIPQKNLHLYQALLMEKDTVRFTATTSFTVGQQKNLKLKTETTWILTGKTPLESLLAYASHIPTLPDDRFAAPLIGWNTWDYYFSALSHEDIMENCEAIAGDEVLTRHMKCCILDMGWEHREGDWYANYRFPLGMEHTAEEIKKKGLVPGIWTNGCQIQTLSYNALRKGRMLLKDQYGDPLVVEGMYVIDPTHPDGAAHFYGIYSRLYGYGYRIFKVDFVDSLLFARDFYKEDYGPYDAIRELFSIVRKAVGSDSHIIGCSYPAECGSGYTDSNRISVDIHNQWGHVRWVMEYLQLSFWENGRLFRIDPDFLLVRGKDTSLEEETNVYNPFANAPKIVGDVSERWRRGEVFDRYEAETWANVVVFAGGNIINSDRLSMLNEKGKELLHTHLEPLPMTAMPLDLGEDGVSSFWYSGNDDKNHLLMINHGNLKDEVIFDFAQYRLAAPVHITANKKDVAYVDSKITAILERHESVVINW